MKIVSSSLFAHITIPTYVTLMRLALTPFIVVSLMSHHISLAIFFFLIAALTDIVDGALARALNMESELGALLDPLADKVLLLSCYGSFAYTYLSFTLIPLWFLIPVLIHEIGMIIGTFALRYVKNGAVIKPTPLGKLSSFGQILFLGWLFLCVAVKGVPGAPFTFILILILAVRACTCAHYGVIAYQSLKKK